MLQTNQFLASKMTTLKPTVFYDFNKILDAIAIIYEFSVQYGM